MLLARCGIGLQRTYFPITTARLVLATLAARHLRTGGLGGFVGYTMAIPEEMRRKYLERRKRDIEELSVASTAADPAPFIRVGHQLKGNAITFGYQELAEVGVRMEEAGNQLNWDEANACLATLKAWWEKQV